MTFVAVAGVLFGGLLILAAIEDQSVTLTARHILAGQYVPASGTAAHAGVNPGPLIPGNPGMGFL